MSGRKQIVGIFLNWLLSKDGQALFPTHFSNRTDKLAKELFEPLIKK